MTSYIFSWRNEYFSRRHSYFVTSYIFFRDIMIILVWRHTYFCVTSYIFLRDVMNIFVWLRCDANNAGVDRSSAIWNERYSGSRLERETLKLDGRNERETDSRSGQYLQKLDMFTCAVVRQRLTKTGHSAAVSGSATAYRLGGVGLGSGTMGKLGRAWVCVWHGVWVVVHRLARCLMAVKRIVTRGAE